MLKRNHQSPITNHQSPLFYQSPPFSYLSISQRKAMRLSISFFLRLFLFLVLLFGLETFCVFLSGKNPQMHVPNLTDGNIPEEKIQDSIEIRVGTFLGNGSRNYYGDSIGNDLQLIWKSFLGK